MLKSVLGAIFALMLVSGAHASTVTFESVSPLDGSPIINAEGFTWDFSSGGGFPFAANGWFIGDPNEGFYPDGTVNGTNILMASGDENLPAGAHVIMSVTGGGVFDLTQLDAASSNLQMTNSLYIIGSLFGGGTVTTTLDLIGSFQTYVLSGFANLLSVKFHSLGSGPYNEAGFALDNLDTTISAVPLPASLPLLLAGIAGLGVLARRKRTA